jgi:hypothetical protein
VTQFFCREVALKGNITMRDEPIHQAIEKLFVEPLDLRREREFRHDDVVIDMPQSGERILGRENF